MRATVWLLSMWLAVPLMAQAQPPSAALPPTLIPLAGHLHRPTGEPRSGSVALVISLYALQDDPTPLWVEQQTVTLGANGRYDLLVGSTVERGLPTHVFAPGSDGRWLGVTVQGEHEQPRVMVISVPYAARAASADRLEGQNAADFLLADDVTTAVRTALKTPTITTSLDQMNVDGIAAPDVVPKWNSALGLGASAIVNVGSKVGIGVQPGYRLDVDGDLAFRGTMLPSRDQYGKTGGLLHRPGSFIVFNDRSALTLSANGRDNHLVVEYRQGKVGIGTIAPVDPLQIDAADSGRLKITRRGVNTALLGDISGANDGALLLYDGSGARKVTVRADGPSFINGGNLGIGTSSPSATLHVVGDGRFDGTVIATNVAARFQDVAEWVNAAGPLAPGTVVIIDDTKQNSVRPSSTAYDSRVAGAVSPQPGLTLGDASPDRVLVSHSGRVRIKVDARYGAIRPGDLLVTSPHRGHAMRARPLRVGQISVQRAGTVLGKALEPLASGSGEILVLLTLQ